MLAATLLKFGAQKSLVQGRNVDKRGIRERRHERRLSSSAGKLPLGRNGDWLLPVVFPRELAIVNWAFWLKERNR